jgi:parvulin-like peptidyl-prolyl isomerase
MSRQRRIPTPSWEKDRGISGGLSGSRLQVLAAVAAGLLVVVAVAAIGFGFLSDYLEDRDRPNTTALKVGDTEFTVRDFSNRARMYVTEIGGTSNIQIVLPSVSGFMQEQVLLLKYANEKEVSATDDEVKTEIATLLGIEATDPAFDQRLAEELESNGLSDQQYRDYARGRVLKDKMQDKFESELPATINSIHYRQIVVSDEALANDIKDQVEGGADFAALAAEHSTDSTTKDTGGDMGWAPEGFLAEAQDSLLFGLDLNQVVVYPSGSSFYIYQVTEKQDRAIDEEKKPTLAQTAYREWLDGKTEAETIEDEMSLVDGDVDKIRWVIDHAGLTSQ